MGRRAGIRIAVENAAGVALVVALNGCSGTSGPPNRATPDRSPRSSISNESGAPIDPNPIPPPAMKTQVHRLARPSNVSSIAFESQTLSDGTRIDVDVQAGQVNKMIGSVVAFDRPGKDAVAALVRVYKPNSPAPVPTDMRIVAAGTVTPIPVSAEFPDGPYDSSKETDPNRQSSHGTYYAWNVADQIPCGNANLSEQVGAKNPQELVVEFKLKDVTYGSPTFALNKENCDLSIR